MVGCTRVSAGCDHCYAVPQSHRLEAMHQPKYAGLTVLNARGERHFNGVVRCDEGALTIPLHWKTPRRIFVNSMSDLFHPKVPFEFIDRVWAVMALCPQHTFQVLTKRPERMAEYFGVNNRSAWVADSVRMLRLVGYGTPLSDPTTLMKMGGYNLREWPLPNVWLGTSCEDQAAADERIPHLRECPAAVLFLSCEPLLGPIRLPLDGIGQVLVGGESGKGARPCEIASIRSIVRLCAAASVPCFVKQLGRWIAGAHDFDGWKGKIDRWLIQDEHGNQSTYTRPILRAEYHPQYYDERPKNAVAWGLGDAKGGDPAEWPEDLRVREFPVS